MRKISLSPAFYFECIECGGENFIRVFAKEITPREAVEYAAQYGGDQSDYTTDKNLFDIPEVVACGRCKHEHDVSHVYVLGSGL